MARAYSMLALLGISAFLAPAFALAGGYSPIAVNKAMVSADLAVLATQEGELLGSECTVDPGILGPLAAFTASRTHFSKTLESDYSEMMTFVTTPIPGNGKCDQSHLAVAEGALKRANRLIVSINAANHESTNLQNANSAVNAVPNFESVDVGCGSYVNSQLQSISAMVKKTTGDTNQLVASLTGTKDHFLLYQTENIKIANSCHNTEGDIIVAAPDIMGGVREPASFVKNPQDHHESTITGEIKNDTLPDGKP